MDPYKPKYKALYDAIDTIGELLQLLVITAALVAIFILTI